MLTILSYCPFELAVILHHHLHRAWRYIGLIDALGRERKLRRADRHRRYMRAVIPRRVNRKRSPAASDLQHAIARLQYPACGTPCRSFPAAPSPANRTRLLKYAHEYIICESRNSSVKLIPQIVVRSNIFLAARNRVRPKLVMHARRKRANSRQKLVPRIQRPQIPHRHPHQRHQIRRRPVAVHVRLAHPDVRPHQRPHKKSLVVNDRHRPQLCIGFAERIRFIRAHDLQKSAAQIPQRFKKYLSRPLLHPRLSSRRFLSFTVINRDHVIPTKRATLSSRSLSRLDVDLLIIQSVRYFRVRHVVASLLRPSAPPLCIASLSFATCENTGTPFTHNFSASQ